MNVIIMSPSRFKIGDRVIDLKNHDNVGNIIDYLVFKEGWYLVQFDYIEFAVPYQDKELTYFLDGNDILKKML